MVHSVKTLVLHTCSHGHSSLLASLYRYSEDVALSLEKIVASRPIELFPRPATTTNSRTGVNTHTTQERHP